jgi:hypothetical protein
MEKPFYFCLWYYTQAHQPPLSATPAMNIKENSTLDSSGLPPTDDPRDGLPPFLNSWAQLYTLMIGTLVTLIILFYLFMTHFQ